MQASEKQLRFWREATHRWNVKVGATRSGKTYMDYFLIPRRLLAGAGKPGLNVIMGNTRETVRRNILLPMQDIFGARRVGDMKADGSVTLELQGSEAQLDRVLQSLAESRYIEILDTEMQRLPPEPGERGFSVRDDRW